MMLLRYGVFGFAAAFYGTVRAYIGTAEGVGDVALSLVALVPAILVVIWIEQSARKEGYSRGYASGALDRLTVRE